MRDGITAQTPARDYITTSALLLVQDGITSCSNFTHLEEERSALCELGGALLEAVQVVPRQDAEPLFPPETARW